MDLEELREKWIDMDRKLDLNIHLNRQLLQATKLKGVRSALQRMIVGLTAESAIHIVVIVALGNFVYEHLGLTRFALPAAVLDLFTIIALQGNLRQIIIANQIDYNKPIATIQKKIGEIRLLRVRYNRWILMTAPLIWTPLFIVLLKAFFGLDAFQIFGTRYILANLLFGMAFIPFIIWVSRRYSELTSHSPYLQQLMRELGGNNLSVANDFLATLSDFEDENRHI